MGLAARLCLTAGVLGLALSVLNQFSAEAVSPAFERAAVLASILSVGLMLVAVLWTRAMPEAPERVHLTGQQGLRLLDNLPRPLREELAWGSQMLLTATPAAAVVLHWRGATLLERGMLTETPFTPGAICERACSTSKAVNLVNLSLYPGRGEFQSLPPETPALIVQPIGNDGVLLLAGWSPRCFSRSDEAWLAGWAQKLRTSLEQLDEPVEPAASASAA